MLGDVETATRDELLAEVARLRSLLSPVDGWETHRVRSLGNVTLTTWPDPERGRFVWSALRGDEVATGAAMSEAAAMHEAETAAREWLS